MYSLDEFTDFIDSLVPDEIRDSVHQQADQMESFLDLVNLQEKVRNYVIKEHISSTHKWHRATCTNSKSHKEIVYWCQDCGIRCSQFENITCLTVIGKVKDDLPTYTVHNQYLMLTCNEVQELMKRSEKMTQCFDCGLPPQGATSDCNMI